MDALRLCLNSFSDENEIHNEMLTLRDCGCIGRAPQNALIGPNGVTTFDESEIPVYHIFYDFKPTNLLDPLLLY